MKGLIFSIVLLLLSLSCQKDEIERSKFDINDPSNGWDINFDDVIGEINDNYPLVNDPVFISVKEVNRMQNSELVFAVKYDETIRVFPLNYIHNIEIVNDYINDLHYAVTLCPKTMSALSWNRIVGNDTAEFRASGMLYKDNLLPLDTKTGDIWSQMLSVCVKGQNAGLLPINVTLIETNWNTIEKYYSNATVFDSYCFDGLCDTVHSANSNKSDPNDEVSDTGINTEINIPPGERVYGLPGLNHLKLFKDELFNDSVHVYSNQSVIVVGNNNINYVQAFYKKSELSFSPVQNSLPIVMVDNEGNYWDIFGYAVDGPRTGDKLSSPSAFKAYFWAWEEMFSKIVVFED